MLQLGLSWMAEADRNLIFSSGRLGQRERTGLDEDARVAVHCIEGGSHVRRECLP